MELKGKKVLIVGFGKSGQAALRFVLAHGARPAVTDVQTPEQLKVPLGSFATLRMTTQEAKVDWYLGGHPGEIFASADLIVVSPGVPWNLAPLKEARAKGIPVVSELELAFQELRSAPSAQCATIAVTGTNGKTTTVSLIHHLLKTAGKKSVLAGNVGKPLLDCLNEIRESQFLVLEISSYQLEATPSLKPAVAVWLNITEDHLDWHENFSAYTAAKAKAIRQTGPNGLVIYNADDTVVAQTVEQIPSNRLPISTQRRVKLGGWVEEGMLWIKPQVSQAPAVFDLSKVALKGIHNWENMLAALLAVAPAIKDRDVLQKGLETFTPLPHRMQVVLEQGGVTYINDSKGTNVGAALKALIAVSGPVIWIAGGRDKGGGYAPLKEWVKKKCRAVFLLGEAKGKMARALEGCAAMKQVQDLQEAVQMASKDAKAGDTVLFSPACSSFDMFKDYAERGEIFMKLVRELK